METGATTERSRCLSICFKTLRMLLGSVLVLAFTLQLRAQMATADVLGTVTDTSGAVVPGAKVTAHNTGTGANITTVTTNTGEYLFTKLQIGTYKLSVEANGFKTFATTGLTLAVGDRTRLDAKLEVGSQVETVEVTASAAAQLQKDTSELSSLIPAESVAEMPTNGRNYYSLMQLEAGTTYSSGSADPTDDRPVMAFSANGMSSEYNNNMIDGLDNNERSLGEVAVEPSLDALEQVKVETNMYSAEYSRTGGGIANLITKSGTNQFHGALFEFMRNDDFDAYPWTIAPIKTKTELRQNQFGGSLGGPILKNKAFFFGDYQGWRQVKGGLAQAYVANQDEYNSLHGTGDIVLEGVTIPRANANPLGLAYLMEAPAPLAGCDPTCPGASYNWQGAANTPQNADTYDGRVDYQINDRNKFFGRYSYNNTSTTRAGSLPAAKILAGDSHTYAPGVNLNNVIAQNLALDYLHVFSANTLFEAKASYLRSNQQTKSPNDSYWTLAALGIPCDDNYCYDNLGVYGFPLISFMGPYSGYNGEGGELGYIENTFQYNASLTMNRGAHSIKTGATLLRRQVTAPTSSFAFIFAGSLSDLAQGNLAAYMGHTVMVKPHYHMWEPSAYIQDDWRATPKLTLNLGVRYDIYTPWTEANGRLGNFSLDTMQIVSPDLLGSFQSTKTGNVNTDFRDISPRLGFAYSLPYSLVLRGGWGVSYFPANEANTGEFELLNTPFVQQMSCGNPMFGVNPCSPSNGFISSSGYANESYANPDGTYNMKYGFPRYTFTNAVAQAENPSDYSSVFSGSSFISPAFKPSYQEEFNLQVQKEVASNIVTTGFVGNLGRRIPTSQDLNKPTNTAPDVYPFNSAATPWMNSVLVPMALSAATSQWLAGEATYSRKLSHGLSASVNYTWSRWKGYDLGNAASDSECVQLTGCTMDTGTGSTVPVHGWQQYSRDAYTTHRAAGMVTYNIPFGQHLQGVLGAAAKGWALNGTGYWQTGAWHEIQMTTGNGPFSNTNVSGIASSRATDFPNRVPGVSLKPTQPGLAFNNQAFVWQTPGTLGNAVGSQVEGPRTRDADLSLGKTFSLRENLKLQFRAECFNFTNTPNYGSSGGGGGPFGLSEGTYAASSYDANGHPAADGIFDNISTVSNSSREFQFGLKLIY
jgi:hypothetical protein